MFNANLCPCSTRRLTWPSLKRVPLHMVVHNPPSTPANTCTRRFCSTCLWPSFHFPFSSFTVLRADSFHHQVQLCHSLTQKSTEKLTPRHRHLNEIKQSLHPGSVSHFLARQLVAILPPCDWRTSGTERLSGAPLKEQMLASSWHMPPRWSREDGNRRGRWGILEGREGRRNEDAIREKEVEGSEEHSCFIS